MKEEVRRKKKECLRPERPAEEELHRIAIEAELDLHTFAPKDIRSVVEEYVSEAAAAGLREVRLVHGRGRGIQRGIVQATLDAHELVVEFWDDPRSSLGATIAVIRAG